MTPRWFGSSRSAPYAALVLLGFALVVAIQSQPGGTRGATRERLIDLIARVDERARDLQEEFDDLQGDLRALEDQAATRRAGFADLQERMDALGVLAGLQPFSGPGMLVELRDSTLRRSPTGDPNDLVIHEEDLQAVVNALWDGGAEAMSINGERIVGTSAVRCVGNTLLLHGAVYSPPYRIRAIGDPTALSRALTDDPLVRRFRIFAEEFRLGFDSKVEAKLEVTAYRGPVATRAARAIRT